MFLRNFVSSWPKGARITPVVPPAIACRVSTESGDTTSPPRRRRDPPSPRQRVELALAGNQHVDHGIVEHRQRERHPPPRVPARALRRRDAADLRGLDRQTPRMKRPRRARAARSGRRTSSSRQSSPRSRPVAARTRGRPAIHWRESRRRRFPQRCSGEANRTPRHVATLARRGLMSTSSTSTAGHAPRQPRDETTDGAGANDATRDRQRADARPTNR